MVADSLLGEVRQGCLSAIRTGRAAMSRSEQKIADYITQQPTDVIYLSITEVADRARVGEATVSRFCRRLGFRGFQDLKLALAQELAPAAAAVGPVGDGKLATLTRQIARRSMKVIEDTALLMDQQGLERAITLLAGAHKIDFYGVGSSGLTALDAQHKFLSIGKLCQAFVDPHVQAISASLLTPADVAVAFSHSGSTKDVVGSLRWARERGARTICVTSAARSPITTIADVVLLAAPGEPTLVGTLHSKIAHLFVMELLFEGCVERLGPIAREAAELTLAAVMDKMY